MRLARVSASVSIMPLGQFSREGFSQKGLAKSVVVSDLFMKYQPYSFKFRGNF